MTFKRKIFTSVNFYFKSSEILLKRSTEFYLALFVFSFQQNQYFSFPYCHCQIQYKNILRLASEKQDQNSLREIRENLYIGGSKGGNKSLKSFDPY